MIIMSRKTIRNIERAIIIACIIAAVISSACGNLVFMLGSIAICLAIALTEDIGYAICNKNIRGVK